ncbi:MAG TPA: polyhydroxyalkanoic acid system family protein [Terriglobales bacterium]|nr:polyhydroxyalkanoic acid system family protein [Terriglobales bacterium]
MPSITFAVAHGRTLDEARQRLETAVQQLSTRFGAVLSRVEWAADRTRVRLEGTGIRAEMWVDARDVHVEGDVAVLGSLLGAPLSAGLKQIVQQTFQKQLS